MKKAIIIGCPGSGKSTFARALAEKTGLPIFHLDNMFWNADRTHVEKPVFLERLRTAMAQDSWIIDGNYNSTMELRMEAADTVFLLDALRSLPEDLQDVLYLHHYEGYSVTETASLLKIPVGTVKTRLSRARIALKKLLEEEP